jgi:hypothetical protein
VKPRRPGKLPAEELPSGEGTNALRKECTLPSGEGDMDWGVRFSRRLQCGVTLRKPPNAARFASQATAKRVSGLNEFPGVVQVREHRRRLRGG